MNMRKTLAVAATVLALPVLTASAQETYKVGSSLGLTGYGSLTDGHWRDGLELAIEAVNAQGGVLGRKLQLVHEDNKSTPQQAVVGYRKMMSEDKVIAFDSGCISAGNFAAASFVSKAKLPMFLCSILPRQADEQKWAFSFLPPPKFEVDARYAYLKEKTDIRKVGILSDPSPYSMLMRGIAEKGAAEFGLTVVANETYQQDDSDFSVQIGRMNAAGAGAIIMLGQGNAVVTVANNMKALGLNKMLLLGSINETDILHSTGKIIGDQYLFPAALIQIASDDLSVIADPASRAAAEAFVKAAKAKSGTADSAQAARAWDSIMMLAAAIKKANAVDGTAVRDTFEKLGQFKGAGASYDFTPEQHVGIINNPYVIAVVKDGKLALKK
ncbi:ABC transporter substrate-binding protein [Pseudolabrys taiwanensis]|uniref:ABC transporter substrate-binding protein n=1 Tax=Pseudolabrys taiwanensis TaxID=331696 RepID=A0A345ZR44_9HYPH|nr:ABC transporter substrate-binding protein [Pseudolabrys taiwanensis]AXK79391.1 ABC transporter substrate-binding protein [Pseudolabrys taiwanensis]